MFACKSLSVSWNTLCTSHAYYWLSHFSFIFILSSLKNDLRIALEALQWFSCLFLAYTIKCTGTGYWMKNVWKRMEFFLIACMLAGLGRRQQNSCSFLFFTMLVFLFVCYHIMMTTPHYPRHCIIQCFLASKCALCIIYKSVRIAVLFCFNILCCFCILSWCFLLSFSHLLNSES